MPVFTYGKQLSKSITLPEGQLTKKKTFSLTSSQRERHSNDKLSSSNFSSGFKPKVPRHSQDKDCDVLFTSCDQTNAREIGNFKQAHRKQRKIKEIVGATKSDGYERQIMNRQQPHAAVEAEKKKIQTEEDKFGNCHTYQALIMMFAIWWTVLWWKCIKQANKIKNFKTDADSSSDKSIMMRISSTGSGRQSLSCVPLRIRNESSIKPKLSTGFSLSRKSSFGSSSSFGRPSFGSRKSIFGSATKKNPRSIKTPATKRPSDSTRNKSVFENLLLKLKTPSSINAFNDKIVPAADDSSSRISLYLMNKIHFAGKADTESARQIAYIKTAHRNREHFWQMKEHQAESHINQTKVDTFREMHKDRENKINKNINYIKELHNINETMQLKFYIEKTRQLEEFKNTNNEERCITQGNDNENVAENHEENGEHLVISQNLGMLTTQDQIQDENTNNEERCITQGNDNENHEENGEHLVTSQNLGMLTTQDQIQDEMVGVPYDALHRFGHEYCFNERLKDIGPSECSMNRLIHRNYVCSDDHLTSYDLQEDSWKGTPGCMRNKYWWTVRAKQIPSSEANTDASSDESLSTIESTRIRLFRNVIRNETYRMMSNIDMVISEAEHLFGLERSRIFFDLLATELCHFGSARAISAFVPNMVESTVRQNVISFFEQSCDMMNILMTLLLRYPDSKRLQQLPEQNFISLMKSVITSSLKTKTKGRKKLSLEGNMYIMVDPKEFERLGEEIPEDVLNRLGCGDEMVVHMFVDTRLERPQPSDRRENGLIQSIYFPSDCRLFIYIPTENGSYWHQLDMRRANRISKCYGR